MTLGLTRRYFEPCGDDCGVLVSPDRVEPDYGSMSRVDLTMLLQRRGVDYSRAFTEDDLRRLARGEEITGWVRYLLLTQVQLNGLVGHHLI